MSLSTPRIMYLRIPIGRSRSRALRRRGLKWPMTAGSGPRRPFWTARSWGLTALWPPVRLSKANFRRILCWQGCLRGLYATSGRNMTDRSVSIFGTRGIPARHGGFETFAQSLALYLAHKGWRVTVYCQSELPTSQIQTDYWQNIELIQISPYLNGK